MATDNRKFQWHNNTISIQKGQLNTHTTHHIKIISNTQNQTRISSFCIKILSLITTKNNETRAKERIVRFHFHSQQLSSKSNCRTLKLPWLRFISRNWLKQTVHFHSHPYRHSQLACFANETDCSCSEQRNNKVRKKVSTVEIVNFLCSSTLTSS